MGKWTVEGWIGWLGQGCQLLLIALERYTNVKLHEAHLLPSNLPRPKTWLRVDKTLILADRY